MSNGHNTHTRVTVQNNMGAEAKITLKHQYSDDEPIDQKTWTVANGKSGSPALRVGYNTGFLRTGADWWFVSAEVGGETWISDDGTWKQCTLKSEDANKTLVFNISPGTFQMNIPSGSCSTSFDKLPGGVGMGEAPVHKRPKGDS